MDSQHLQWICNTQNGFATIVFPWQPDQFQRILGTDGLGIRWSDLSADNFAPVANEHLRQDIGAVMSWENQTGPAFGSVDSETGFNLDVWGCFQEAGNH